MPACLFRLRSKGFPKGVREISSALIVGSPQRKKNSLFSGVSRLRAVGFGLPALLLAPTIGSPLWAASNVVPDWVKTAAQQALPSYPKSTKAVMLLNETTYTVAPDGRATTHVRKVVKILRPQGREYGYPVVWFDKDSKVVAMHVWSIDPAGHEYALKDNEIREISPPGEGGQLYADEKAKVADPPGRDPGGIIAYEYEVRDRPYLAEANWFFKANCHV